MLFKQFTTSLDREMFRNLEIKSSKIMFFLIFLILHASATICHEYLKISIGFHRKRWQTDSTHTPPSPVETFCTCLFPAELTQNTFLNSLRALLTSQVVQKSETRLLDFVKNQDFSSFFAYINMYLSIFDAFQVHFGEISPKSRDGTIFASKKINHPLS